MCDIINELGLFRDNTNLVVTQANKPQMYDILELSVKLFVQSYPFTFSHSSILAPIVRNLDNLGHWQLNGCHIRSIAIIAKTRWTAYLDNWATQRYMCTISFAFLVKPRSVINSVIPSYTYVPSSVASVVITSRSTFVKPYARSFSFLKTKVLISRYNRNSYSCYYHTCITFC